MRYRAAVSALLGLGILLGFVFLGLGRPARVTGQQNHGIGPGPAGQHAAMSDEAMRRWSESWWASHPPVGTASTQAPSATFTVRDFRFDSDNNAATQVDTAKIMVGESVLWQWISGFHTITNGSGDADPDAGTVFDQPSDNSHQQFTFTFNSVGTFPFFCRFHEFANMRGVVRVSAATGVGPGPRATLGFTSPPSPNPSRGATSFTFSLREAGRARAEVLDPRGRLVAVILDRELAAGPHSATWDGRSLAGGSVPTGVYFVRLRLPAFTGTQPLVIAR